MNYTDKINLLTSRLKEAQAIIKETLSEISKFEKQISKDKKSIDKSLKKDKESSVDRSINGFSKPGNVSDELRDFFGLEKEQMIARTEITKKLLHIVMKNLQKEDDKRIILADEPLKKLLRLKNGDELTYFNLQKYMKIHFPNKEGQLSN